MVTKSRLGRLRLDISELLTSPYPGVSIHLDDSNIYQFCLHLCPESGPYAGLRLHFDIELPREWPLRPPQVRSTAHIDHPNIFGHYICCDLLEEALPVGYTGGYSAALTLSGLFMQFLTFFSSKRIEQKGGYWVTLGDAWVAAPIQTYNGQIQTAMVRNWRWDNTYRSSSMVHCPKCGYGNTVSNIVSVWPVHAVQTPLYMVPPTKCHLSMLNDDTLYALLDALPSEALLAFSAAYPRVHDLMTYAHILLLRELRCFFLRQPLGTCILGIGVHLDQGACTLSSEFDWLSEQAFTDFCVRRAIRKRPFEFFLPLAFSRTHFARAQDAIWRRIVILDDAVQKAFEKRRFNTRVPRTRPVQAVRVIYQFMNNAVVALMKSADAILDMHALHSRSRRPPPHIRETRNGLLLASEHAVIAYCQLYHLLTSLAAGCTEVLHEATVQLWQFIRDPSTRRKEHVPDMGEFIVKASLVLGAPPIDGYERLTWRNLNGFLLEEVFVRNVMWMLRDHPDLEVLETGASEYRLQKTFESAKTALRLTMFQVAFLSTFVAAHVDAPTRLGDAYGFPVRSNAIDAPIEQHMVETIKGIYAVRTWSEFFEKVQFAGGLGWSKERFSGVLRACIVKSERAGYHVPCVNKAALEEERREREGAWDAMVIG